MTVSLNDSSTHERYTLSLHDALPISKTTDKVKILPNPDFCVEIVPGKKVISKVAINIGKILLQLESDPEVAENPHNERQILIRCENIEMVCMIAIADPGFADYLKL